MYIMCKDKVIDLEKFDGIEINREIISEEYTIDAVKGDSSKGVFRMEIVRLKKEEDAVELLNELSVCWVRGHDYFDMKAYFDDIPCSGFRDMLGE